MGTIVVIITTAPRMERRTFVSTGSVFRWGGIMNEGGRYLVVLALVTTGEVMDGYGVRFPLGLCYRELMTS